MRQATGSGEHGAWRIRDGRGYDPVMKMQAVLVVLSLLATGAAACGGNVVVDASAIGGSSTTTSGTGAAGGATTTSTAMSSSGMPCVPLVKLTTNAGSVLLTALCDPPYDPLMST